MNRSSWKALLADFDHTRRLGPDDEDLFVERPKAVISDIMSAIELYGEENKKWVMCGSVGSGKSTELIHLGRLLRASHFVVGVDLPLSVASIERIQPAEVLFLIGAAAVRAGREQLGHEFSEGAINELLVSFSGLLEKGIDVDIGAVLEGVVLFVANIAAPGSAAIAGAATKALKGFMGRDNKVNLGAELGGLTRPLREGDPDLRRLVQAVDRVMHELRGYRSPIVLVDGLDKIHDKGTNRALFGTTGLLSAPAVPVVYAAPITLMLGTEWNPVSRYFERQRLSNVIVAAPASGPSPSAEKVEAGVAVMREMVQRRLKRHGLSEGDAFEDGQLTRLICSSGGLLRGLIHLIREAIEAAYVADVACIGADQVDAAIHALSLEFEITMTGAMMDELHYVREHGRPSGNGEQSLELLLDNYVLPYSNGRAWFAPHPLVARLL